MKKIILLTFSILISLATLCHALHPETHELINEYVAKNSMNGFELHPYLQEQLDIKQGVEQEFEINKVKNQAWKWLKKGGTYEDEPPLCLPYVRSVNHFHEPVSDEGFIGFYGISSLFGDSSIE